MHRQERDTGCGPSCRWRQLYEGNLLSLGDLNDKLRAAVGRHGRLRNNLISVMRKAFPTPFLEAERRESRRMSDQSDEVLLRYLTMWLAQRPGTGLQAGPGLADLRGALTTAGFVLPPDGDLTAWAKAVSEQDAARQREQDARDAATAAGQRELAGVFDPHTDPRPVSPGDPVGPGPVDDDHPAADDDLAALFADLPSAPTPGRGPDGPDEPPSPDAQPVPAKCDTSPAVQAQGTAEPDGTAPPAVEDADRPAHPAASAGRKAQQDAPLRPQLFPSPKPGGKTRRRKPKAETTASAQSPSRADIDVPQSERAPGDGPVPDDLHDRAVELAKRPQPLFTSDLVALGIGSEEDVAAWEQACRDDADSPVRFIPPKSRHRQRGGLVIPYAYTKHAPADFKRTTWSRMLEQYRGARLYEIAVVIHRVQDDLMSADLHDGHVVLRLAQPRGLVGLIVTTEGDFDRGDDARDALTGAIDGLLGTPLTLLGVLCTNHNALPKAIKAIEEEARERSWQPRFPVIAQRSWEYAADRGSSSTLVLGG